MIPFLLAAMILPDPLVRHEPVELRTPTGTLYGTLDLPTAGGPCSVVLVLAGSGPTDRDGNQPGLKTDDLRMLGRTLAADGIAALRTDKRGIAASAKAMAREDDVRFETYAADAAAWIGRLRQDGRFTAVGVIGHSEGSLVGTLAAKTARVDALVSLCGPGRPLQTILREQLKKNLSKDRYEASEKILAELAAGRPVKDTPKDLAALFRPSVQGFLISAFRYDPAKELAALSVPVLIVAGGTDIQVSPADAQALAAATGAAKLVTIADMCHVLKEQKSTKLFDQLLTYMNREQPLHPRLVPEVTGFLKPALARK